ncbi:MAG: MBL fold metallo-hydrolase [Candidatus Firestonebacteria bacterium]
MRIESSNIQKSVEIRASKGIYEKSGINFTKPLAMTKKESKYIMSLLEKYAPDTENKKLRLEVLNVLDRKLIFFFGNSLSDIGYFYQEMMKKVLLEIEEYKVKKGLVIWQTYGHGFIVKCPEIIFGFDIISGIDKICISSSLRNSICQNLETLFVSHVHYDHMDINIIKKMISLGKTVFLSSDIYESLSRFKNCYELPVAIKESIATLNESIEVKFFAGHQNPYCSNTSYYIKTRDGISILHMGDQNDPNEILSWVKKLAPVDVLLFNATSTSMIEIIDEIKPRNLILGHLYEYGHPLRGFSLIPGCYKEAIKLFAKHKPIIMTWGECLRILPSH